MESINRGQMVKDRNPAVNGRSKGLDRSEKGKKRDKARNSALIKYLKLLHFSPMLNVADYHTISHRAIQDLTVY